MITQIRVFTASKVSEDTLVIRKKTPKNKRTNKHTNQPTEIKPN